jgi:hypothetical protein
MSIYMKHCILVCIYNAHVYVLFVYAQQCQQQWLLSASGLVTIYYLETSADGGKTETCTVIGFNKLRC